MGGVLKRVMGSAWVAHLGRAIDRYTSRLGDQFAAAITYFSVLAIIPILMFAFAILGLTIEVLRPDLALTLVQVISERLESASGARQITDALMVTLRSWRGVLLFGLLSAGYAGSGWVANIRQAINAMWHPEGIRSIGATGIVGWLANLGKNLLILVGLMILGAVTVGASLSATAAQSFVLGWLGLRESGVASALTVVAALIISLVSGWTLFLYLYWILPRDHGPFRAIARGAVFGSVGLAVLQYSAGALNGLFVRNLAAAIFGPIIVLMLSLNVFATLVLLGASWTATAGPVEDEPLVPDEGEPDATLLALAENPYVTGLVMVPQKVAKRGVTVGIVAGYVLGGAAGVGLGAVLGRLAGAVAHRRRR